MTTLWFLTVRRMYKPSVSSSKNCNRLLVLPLKFFLSKITCICTIFRHTFTLMLVDFPLFIHIGVWHYQNIFVFVIVPEYLWIIQINSLIILILDWQIIASNPSKELKSFWESWHVNHTFNLAIPWRNLVIIICSSKPVFLVWTCLKIYSFIKNGPQQHVSTHCLLISFWVVHISSCFHRVFWDSFSFKRVKLLKPKITLLRKLN